MAKTVAKEVSTTKITQISRIYNNFSHFLARTTSKLVPNDFLHVTGLKFKSLISTLEKQRTN